ncbi:MAG: hypothetical protein AAF467_01370 [Actinomycetota bacterium]
MELASVARNAVLRTVLICLVGLTVAWVAAAGTASESEQPTKGIATDGTTEPDSGPVTTEVAPPTTAQEAGS